MMTITRGLLAGVALVGAAVGLAGPASAQLDPGTYTATATADQGLFAGVKSRWVVTSCGENCLTVLFSNGKTVNFQLQGNNWIGSDPECVWTVDNNSLVYRADCGGGASMNAQLSKDG